VKPFLDLVTAEQALRAIGELGALGTERIESRAALGRVVAEEVRAGDDIPHFRRSNMDGFAVRAVDTAGASESSSAVLRVIGQVAMGEAARVDVEPGTAVRVSTGAMMPAGADAVVIVERTEDAGERGVAIRDAAVAGQNTVAIGEDLRAGDLVFEPGRRLKGSDVGVLTGVGLSTVEVHRIPRVGVMATGDEIVEPEDTLGPGQVRNVNEYLLASLARQCGAQVSDYGVVADREDVFGATLESAVADNDAVFISGGSSKGARDLTRPTIEALPGARIVLHGIAIAPGKPTILARAPGTAIMGLPGNPAAAAVVFSLFGQPLVRVLAGEPLERILLLRPTVRARLAEAVRSTPGREDYVRARVEAGAGLPIARPLRGKSVAISTIARADGLLRVPLSSEGLDEGTEVDIILL
jgi:molybdopterin molybdotransferase